MPSVDRNTTILLTEYQQIYGDGERSSDLGGFLVAGTGGGTATARRWLMTGIVTGAWVTWVASPLPLSSTPSGATDVYAVREL